MTASRSSRAILLLTFAILAGQALAQLDKWEVVVNNAGVSAMSAALMHTNRVIIYDRTDFGPSNLTHPDGYCRDNPNELKLKHDCTAHSVVLDLATNTIKPLRIFTDPWCSSASHKADGSLLSTGGWNDGGKAVRTIGPNRNDDWRDPPSGPLLSPRWYASNHILPDNRVIVVGGRRAFSYEFVPGSGLHRLPFLRDTNTPGAEHNLYPFLFLIPDGNLYIFANQDSILFNYKTDSVVRTYPRILDGPRNYPASGSAVLLPLSHSTDFRRAEVLICGGTPFLAFENFAKGKYDTALKSCGRIVVTDTNAKWKMLEMPTPRLMGDMLILPTGEALIINGAGKGSAGWKSAIEPVFTPVTFDPTKNRFFSWSPSTIPRMYHSTALVLPDGKIFVGGSNVHLGYEFNRRKTDFPTELRIEKYSPYYLNKRYNLRRPRIVASPVTLKYNARFRVEFETGQKPGVVTVRLYAPSFTTHTFSMNQRMLVLKNEAVVQGKGASSVFVFGPPSAVVAPAGYYMCTVVNDGTPSPFVWIKVG